MKNVINILQKYVKKFGDINLWFLFLMMYICIFSIYKFFALFQKNKISFWWNKSTKENLKNINLPY